MGALNPNALSKFVGILEVAPQATPGALVRIGSVRGLTGKVDNSKSQVEVKADDTGTVFKGYLPEASIVGSFLENVDRDLMYLLLTGTPADTAASIVNNHVQTIAQGAWDYNVFLPFDHQNGDGSKITPDSVTLGTNGAIVSETDFFITKNDDGVWGIIIKDSATVTTIAQTVVIQFDYTPNASEKLTIPITFTEAPRLYVRITATDSGKDRTIILDDASFEGTFGIEFFDVVEAGDIKGTEFTFKGNKGSNFIIDNEIL